MKKNDSRGRINVRKRNSLIAGAGSLIILCAIAFFVNGFPRLTHTADVRPAYAQQADPGQYNYYIYFESPAPKSIISGITDFRIVSQAFQDTRIPLQFYVTCKSCPGTPRTQTNYPIRDLIDASTKNTNGPTVVIPLDTTKLTNGSYRIEIIFGSMPFANTIDVKVENETTNTVSCALKDVDDNGNGILESSDVLTLNNDVSKLACAKALLTTDLYHVQQLTIEPPSATFNDYGNLTISSPFLLTTDTIYWRYMIGQDLYTGGIPRTLQTDHYINNVTVSVPFDAPAFPDGAVKVSACTQQTWSTEQIPECGPWVTVSIKLTATTFESPTENAVYAPGSSIPVSLIGPDSIAGYEIKFEGPQGYRMTDTATQYSGFGHYTITLTPGFNTNTFSIVPIPEGTYTITATIQPKDTVVFGQSRTITRTVQLKKGAPLLVPVTPTNPTTITPTAVASPTITMPKTGTPYYSLPSFSGSISKGSKIEYRLNKEAFRLANVQTDAKGIRTFYIPFGKTLAPGNYTLEVVAVDGTQKSAPTVTYFSITQPSATFTEPADKTTITGTTGISISVKGSVMSVKLFGTSKGSVGGPLLLGSLSEMSNQASGQTSWFLAYDTTQSQNGTYELTTKLETTTGLTLDGPKLTVTIKNDIITADNPSAGTTTTVKDVNFVVPQPAADPLAAVEAKPDVIQVVAVKPIGDLPPRPNPRTDGELTPDILAVREAVNVGSVADGNANIVLRGIGPPNSIVTLYIYSDIVIVTTRTDGNGNWSYTLDKSLGEGGHEVYVAVTDSTGKIQQKSSAFNFFISQARAMTEAEYLNTTASVPAQKSDRYLALYLIIAALAVMLTTVVFLLVRTGRSRSSTATP